MPHAYSRYSHNNTMILNTLQLLRKTTPPITLTGTFRATIIATSIIALGACSSSNNDAPTSDIPPADDTDFAFVATRSSDFESGRIDRISLDDGNTINGSYPATFSDIVVTNDGKNLYQIGRYKIDSVTRFNALDTSIVDYQYSVNGDDAVIANPYAIAFVDQTKAYLTRRGSDNLWIIDPSPESEAGFKIGELDLGAYDTDLPNMTDAIVVDGKLFVLIERLLEQPSGAQIPDKSAYIAVFDTSTDTEIQTTQGSNDLKGIELIVRNPTALQYNQATGEIYVVGRGNFFESSDITTDFHSGGIEVIDPTTYEHSLLIDDGTDADNNGYFTDAVVINAQLGYLVTYTGYQSSTLRTFNPITGLLTDDLFEGLQDTDITLIAEGSDAHLWVGVSGETPGFMRIDLATGLIAAERVTTELIPLDITFISIAVPSLAVPAE